MDLSTSDADKATFFKAFGNLLNSPRHSDLALYIGPQKVKFYAHYAILSVRTNFFDKAKDRGFKEGQENVFIFNDFQPHAFYRMLQYIYTGDYSVETKRLANSSDDDRELLIHTRVYVIADYFNIVDLKVLCARKFGKQASSYWRGDTLVDAIADIYSIPFAPEHPMRKAVIKIAHEHLTELHQNMEFQRLLKEYAEFSAELIEAMLQPENRLSCEPVHLNNSVDISSMDTPQLEDSPMARVPDLLLETKVQPFPVRSPQERIEHISANSTFFFPPLWQAASDGNEASVRQLLERGADVNEMSSGESTALHIAACGGFEVVARLLLEKGADVNAKSRHGDTALHLAACYMHIGVARLLLEMGADVNAKSDNESTALFEALYSKDEAMMRLLLENGADAKAKNKYGYTVLYIATIRQYTTIVQLILEYGTGMETGDSCMSALVQKEVEEIVIEENAIETVGNNKLKGGLMKNQETAIETGDDNKLKGNTIFRNIKKLKNLQILK